MGPWWRKSWRALESMLAVALSYFIYRYLDANDLGSVTGEDGLLKILPGQIRARTFVSSAGNGFPAAIAQARIFALAPDLAVEIISKGNTKREMVASCGNTFRQACGWCGTSSPRPALHGPTRPSRSGRRLVLTVLSWVASSARFRITACPVVRPRRKAAEEVRGCPETFRPRSGIEAQRASEESAFLALTRTFLALRVGLQYPKIAGRSFRIASKFPQFSSRGLPGSRPACRGPRFRSAAPVRGSGPGSRRFPSRSSVRGHRARTASAGRLLPAGPSFPTAA